MLVTRAKEKIETACGMEFLVRRTVLAGSAVHLNSYAPEHFADVAEIRIDKQNRSGNRDVKIPPDVSRGIARFLRLYNHPKNDDFDCYSFANLLHRFPLFEPKAYLLSRWSLERLSGKPDPGGVVFLMEGRENFKHAAIYLGADIYVSVYGAGGQLEFSELNDMRHDFRASSVFLATPAH